MARQISPNKARKSHINLKERREDEATLTLSNFQNSALNRSKTKEFDSVLKGFKKVEKQYKVNMDKDRQNIRQETLKQSIRSKEKREEREERSLSRFSKEGQKSTWILDCSDLQSDQNLSPQLTNRSERERKERCTLMKIRESPIRQNATYMSLTSRENIDTEDSPRDKQFTRPSLKLIKRKDMPRASQRIRPQEVPNESQSELNLYGFPQIGEENKEKTFDVSFENPDMIQKSYKKLINNTQLGLLPLYNKQGHSVKIIKTFKINDFALQSSQLSK